MLPVPTPRTIAWLDPAHLPLVRELARLADLSVIGAGSPTRGQSSIVAGELETTSFDDLRATLASAEADLFLIAAPGELSSGREDAGAILAARARGARIATLEPIPASAMDLLSGGWLEQTAEGRAADSVRFCPLWRRSATFLDATEVLESLGPVRTLSIQAWSGRGEGSLGARLFAALGLVHTLMGEPETIDAAYIAPTAGPGLHALPGESLRRLSGDLTANIRFADRRAASLTVSDHAGRWNQSAELLGPGGRLRFSDDTFEWIAADGAIADESRKRRRSAATASTAAHAIADQVLRLLDSADPDPRPLDHAAVLSMSQAALLSARTGQPESPATIRRVAGLDQ